MSECEIVMTILGYAVLSLNIWAVCDTAERIAKMIIEGGDDDE